MKDGDIDYSGSSASELDEALASIRKDQFPRNYANLQAARARLGANAPEPCSEAGDARPQAGPRFSRRSRNAIFAGGWLLLLVGGALCLGGLQRFAELPNFLRIALVIPLTLGSLMLHVDTFNEWDRQSSLDQSRATSLVLVLAGLFVGSLLWLLFAPGARS
jgi:hypothetical protein